MKNKKEASEMNKIDYIERYFKDANNLDLNNCPSCKDIYSLQESEQEHLVPIMKSVKCKDGFEVSVQASWAHYCHPKITYRNNFSCIYDSFELGFPSKDDDLLKNLGEDKNTTRTIYSFINRNLVNHLIKKHGGLLNE